MPSTRTHNFFLLYFLENRLAAAEQEVNRANLGEKLANLDEIKNIQNQNMKTFQNEIDQLDSDVNNIKLISDSLPDGCFKRTRLEP